MKKLSTLFIVMVFALSCLASANAADVNNGLNDLVIGSTKPQITGEAVNYHIRILEFVLATRMTVAQKQLFLKAIETEIKKMDTDQLNVFLDAVGLADSLNKLSEKDTEPIRQLLEKDFNSTVASLEGEDDLAAKQFRQVQANLKEKVIATEELTVSKQSVEALAEYLAFIANTKNPIWPNELHVNTTALRIRTGYKNYTEDEKDALEDFQLTWYLIRAAWQMADAKQRATWQKGFDKLGIKPGADVTSANIRSAISTDVYGDILDFATKAGIEPIEWSTKTTAKIW